MRVTQLGCLQNQTAFDTSRNDCVAICSNNGHSFGAGYGKFYTSHSNVFSLHDFSLSAVKFIWFANVYNLPQLCFRIDFFNLFTPFFLGGGRPELHGLCTVVLDFHFGRWESYIIFVFWSCIQSTYI